MMITIGRPREGRCRRITRIGQDGSVEAGSAEGMKLLPSIIH